MPDPLGGPTNLLYTGAPGHRCPRRVAARGFTPPVAGISVVATLGTVLVLTRHTGRAWRIRLIPGIIGSIVGAAVVVVGADPTALGLGLIPWQSSLAYHIVSAAVASALILAGILALRRIANA